MMCIIIVLACVDVVLSNSPVLPKCCGINQQLDRGLRHCEPAPDTEGANSATLLAAVRRPGPPWRHLRFNQRPNCSDPLTLRIDAPTSDRVQWLANGSLVLRSPTARDGHVNITLGEQDFCVDTAAGSASSYSLLLCPCKHLHCFSKCCPLGYVQFCIDTFNCECLKSNEDTWKPFHDMNPPPSELDVSYEILPNNTPVCKNGTRLWMKHASFHPHFILQNWWAHSTGYMYQTEHFCGDIVHRGSTYRTQGLGTCFHEMPFARYFTIEGTMHMCAGIVLTITFIILIIVPTKKTSAYGHVHRKSLLCHIVALILANLTFGSFILTNDIYTYCTLTPTIAHFAIMAASFWLNVMCINMARGFGNPRGIQEENGAIGRKMFLYYSVFAWGCTIFMSALVAGMFYGKSIPNGWLRPTMMESRTCFWEVGTHGKIRTFLYFYGPIGSLLLVNAGLFVYTSLKVRHLGRRTAILKSSESDVQPIRDKYRSTILYIKLLWLMGVMEMVAEIIAWAVYNNGFYFHLSATIVDVLRAVVIFVLCVCRSKTMKALRGRLRNWPCADRDAQSLNHESGPSISNESQRSSCPRLSSTGETSISHNPKYIDSEL